MNLASPIRPLARAVLRAQPDDRLVLLTRRGDEAAFAEIVRRYREPLVSFASAYTAHERAEDVVQESLVRTWSAIRDTDREIALKPWLHTVVRNAALNATRDGRFHVPLDDRIDGVGQPGEIVLEREELARVTDAVRALPAGQRRALVRSALDGRTHDQIAAELGTSPGSVRGLIHRGRSAVRATLASLVPLPALAALAQGSGGTVAATLATGTATGGSSLATKGAALAATGALALGSGVAINRGGDEREAPTRKGARAHAHTNEPPGGRRPALDEGIDSGGQPSEHRGAREDDKADERDEHEESEDEDAREREGSDDDRDEPDDENDAVGSGSRRPASSDSDEGHEDNGEDAGHDEAEAENEDEGERRAEGGD